MFLSNKFDITGSSTHSFHEQYNRFPLNSSQDIARIIVRSGRDGSHLEAASNVTVIWRDTDVPGKSTFPSILEQFFQISGVVS